MSKSDQYYFTDSVFQLELNLHNKRRELILMIEEFEKEDCSSCLQLKCRCVNKSIEKNSSFISIATNDDTGTKNKEDTPSKAPPAESLPKPKFEKEVEKVTTSNEGNKDIEAWIEASRTAQHAKTNKLMTSDVLLATLAKSWGESRSDLKKEKFLDELKKEKIIRDTRYVAANAVELFFNSFKMQPSVTAANLAYVTNVAAIYSKQKSKSSEYTYF